MRCGGCGAKAGGLMLRRILGQLRWVEREDVLIGLGAPDDAAVTLPPPGAAVVHTVDFFRAFIDDPYLFGRIGANHCLGDIYAMGAEPQIAMALAVIPFGPERRVEQDLTQLMLGATQTLAEAGAALAGGHTAEGAELGFGLSVTGLADPGRLLRKSGMQPGDHLILTKPLGTGALFAADMRRKARGAWIEAALESMLRSNAAAAACLRRHHATACTDVTGFGLLGHLGEMLKASSTDAELDLDRIPALEGALETIHQGILSSLHPQNLELAAALTHSGDGFHGDLVALLLDPQTAGGLLASVPSPHSERCLSELRQAGGPQAELIGKVRPLGGDSPRVHWTS
jgi:selenide,water dikinase